MNIKNIEVKFEYQDKIVTIKSETYRTIKEVKEKAIKQFFKIPKNVHCFYLSRDLINYENNIIGEFFNNRQKVTLKLMQPRKNRSKNGNKLTDKSEENIFSSVYLNTNIFSPGFNNIARFEMKKIKGNSLEIKERKKKDNLVLPFIKSKKQALKQKESTYQKYDMDLVNLEEEENKLCENCEKNDFSEFCRNCKEFICVNCKKNDKHKNHLFIHLNSNLESNIKIYGNILLTDIEYFKKKNNNINKIDDKFTNFSSLLNIEDLEEKQKSLINKIREIFNKFEAVINKIKSELIIETETRIKDLINIYNENSLKINNDINQLIKQLESQTKELNIKEFKNFFEKMSENEDKINNINKDIIKYHLISQINSKIDSSFNKMDQIAKETINSEKNPFNLTPILNTELNNILNIIENKENNKNNKNNKYIKKRKTKRYKTDNIIKEENINDSGEDDKND